MNGLALVFSKVQPDPVQLQPDPCSAGATGSDTPRRIGEKAANTPNSEIPTKPRATGVKIFFAARARWSGRATVGKLINGTSICVRIPLRDAGPPHMQPEPVDGMMQEGLWMFIKTVIDRSPDAFFARLATATRES